MMGGGVVGCHVMIFFLFSGTEADFWGILCQMMDAFSLFFHHLEFWRSRLCVCERERGLIQARSAETERCVCCTEKIITFVYDASSSGLEKPVFA